MSKFNYQAHFSDLINFGAIRDKVFSAHLKPPMTYEQCFDVVSSHHYPLTLEEIHSFSKALKDYSDYSNTDFFFWITPCSSPVVPAYFPSQI
ncbi:hypothetical protein [Moraxella lincolnii]|uniref:hypothetical protein n=1 Tax=Lwoffella lincolnii TaxID=90241 RepID=UPI000993CAC5|nr:hypothetical protein [Moraxella lincolnii]